MLVSGPVGLLPKTGATDANPGAMSRFTSLPYFSVIG